MMLVVLETNRIFILVDIVHMDSIIVILQLNALNYIVQLEVRKHQEEF